jgi:hypothetical protein
MCLDDLETDEPRTAWDCDPFFQPERQSLHEGLDVTDDEGDWQVIALDRHTRISTTRYGGKLEYR